MDSWLHRLNNINPDKLMRVRVRRQDVVAMAVKLQLTAVP